jgi:hypothetical protein
VWFYFFSFLFCLFLLFVFSGSASVVSSSSSSLSSSGVLISSRIRKSALSSDASSVSVGLFSKPSLSSELPLSMLMISCCAELLVVTSCFVSVSVFSLSEVVSDSLLTSLSSLPFWDLFCFLKSCFRVEATLLRVRGSFLECQQDLLLYSVVFGVLPALLGLSPSPGAASISFGGGCPLVISLPFGHGWYLAVLRIL